MVVRRVAIGLLCGMGLAWLWEFLFHRTVFEFWPF